MLDSCAFLWLDQGAEGKFGRSAAKFLQQPTSQLILSAASVWELSIKCSLGKLNISDGLEAAIFRKVQTGRIELMPVTARHALFVQSLKRHHGDPFDRMLIAQASMEGLPIISADSMLDVYGVKRMWD